MPVCNSFKSKILNDQLCYEIDLNNFSKKDDIAQELESGLAFIMDYNEDRQIELDQELNDFDDAPMVKRITKPVEDKKAFIYLNTIGECHTELLQFAK